jgi:hypothetical protein
MDFAKGKPTERWRRKVSGLTSFGSMTAGLPQSSPSTGLLGLSVCRGDVWEESRHACIQFQRGEHVQVHGVPRLRAQHSASNSGGNRRRGRTVEARAPRA